MTDAFTSLGNGTLHGESHPEIVHFDATQRRREKMRLKAQDHLKSEQATAPVPVPQPSPATPPVASGTKPAPAPSVKPTQAPAPQAQKPNTNGVGSLGAYAIPNPVPAPATKVSTRQDLETFLVNFVVEQTGYPPEMVELDADLEADLGIDSIKKAQMMAELAEQFQIKVNIAEGNLSLDDFPTLRHVVQLLESGNADPVTTTPAVPTSERAATPIPQNAPLVAPSSLPALEQPAPASAQSREELETFLVNFVVEQTGYPPEMVELDADLEADLGIDSIKKAQMMAELAEQFQIKINIADGNLSLEDFPTLRHVCDLLAAVPGQV